MIKTSVIIPFFQREAGILRRGLESILRQRLPEGVEVHVVVIDDGSPVAAQSELSGLSFQPPFHLTLITQPNGGVSAARNAGLRSLDDSTDYIAFLDSDDVWHEDHLKQGIESLETGYDFYFSDNVRPGHHASQFTSFHNLIVPYIEARKGETIIEMGKAEMFSLILRDFPGQASTTIYRRKCAPGLLFEDTLKVSGEDMLFYLQVCRAASRVCFSPEITVECGCGINMYFESLGWDAPGHFRQVIGRLRSHIFIREQFALARQDRRFNEDFIAEMRRKIAFLLLRSFLRNRGKWPAEAGQLISEDRWTILWLPIYSIQVIISRALGFYRPA